MKKGIALVFTFLFGLLTTAAMAQEPVGSISGTVRDPQGAVVTNAEVTVRNEATNVTRTVNTGSDGTFQLKQLPAGNYEVKVAAANFKQTLVSGLAVVVGGDTRQDINLEIGGASEQVTVVGVSDAPVSTSDNTVAGVVNTRQIQNLPLNGRN